MPLNGKMQQYAEARAQGLAPQAAGLAAGYSGSGLAVTVSRIEKRDDVRAEIKRLKRGGKPEPESKTDDGSVDSWAMKDRYDSPLALLEDVMNNPKAPKGIRYQAAKDALPYKHARVEGGKKQEKDEKAKRAVKGKFQPGNRPSMYQ